MRELTLEEQLLISGGTSTELSATNTYDENEIVVVGGDGGGGGGDWGGGDWGGGDYGDYGDYGDTGGGGGGGGDSPPPEPEPEPEIVVTAARPSQTCPVNDWWPNMFEDWGNVEALTPPVGPWTQWYHNQGTWCFYDDNDVLQAKFVDDPNGKETFTFNNANGQPSFNAGAAGFSGGYATNDSTSISITFHVTRVYE